MVDIWKEVSDELRETIIKLFGRVKELYMREFCEECSLKSECPEFRLDVDSAGYLLIGILRVLADDISKKYGLYNYYVARDLCHKAEELLFVHGYVALIEKKALDSIKELTKGFDDIG